MKQEVVTLKERVRLTHPFSSKETYHIVLDLKTSALQYNVGDCIGIHPKNQEHIITSILTSLNASGNEVVQDRDGHPHSFKTFLKEKANLERVSKSLYSLVTKEEPPENLHDLEVHDLLRLYPSTVDPQTLAAHVSPLLPRLYSIASSQKVVGAEVHLTVALTQYERQGETRFGVCSHYLCKQDPEAIAIYHHSSKDFTLPDQATPVIMIGPGTGVAPFRGFLQERLLTKNLSKQWLFFGERNQAHDFYYEDYLKPLASSGDLHLDLAFSRDQPEKVYVQHKMLEKASTLWKWISEGACLYVCGDAHRMAKDVGATLQTIIMQEGALDKEGARAFIKQLRKDKRYLRDVY